MMKKLDLSGSWQLRLDGCGEELAAKVPGSVYADLLEAGKMDDPYYRDNEMKALALMEHDFLYSRSFSVGGDMLCCDRVLLHCDGLDTLAKISVNGHNVGSADNMHRVWEFDIKPFVHTGENDIEILLESPTRYIKAAYNKNPAGGSEDAMQGFPLLRKAHCMFGWDWGPRLPDAGIWRNISILGFDGARIDNVYVKQNHENGRVRLNIETALEIEKPEPYELRVSVKAPNGTVLKASGESCEIEIDNPELWWPNGFGSQPLYTVSVALFSGDEQIDEWSRRIGLRTMSVRIEKDEFGESFCHCVNGVDVFAMGGDYIPEDNILPRVNPERTRRLLEDAALANFNTIRVWGGGYYPDDFFYDICDELGLMVWQDFMYACAVYNLTPEFEENIRAEVIDNVRRLRHHASLGLWCGNNEMEQFVDDGGWDCTPSQRADYIKMYEYIFPQILKKEDPQSFYWPASPSSGGSFDEPNSPDRGDVHYWAVWHGGLPFTDYRNHFFRYVSEFGFQSFPCLKTVEAFTEPEDRNVFSYVMEKHQRNASANGKILAYLSQMYLYPRDLDTLCYASQLLQAQAMQYGVEHWRRNRGRCMGAVVWQLNDCWPVASWASIDYIGRWKALHYYEKRFFAPVLVSCMEDGVLSQNTNVNADPSVFALKKTARLNVSNESRKPFEGTVYYSLRNPDASVIFEGSKNVSVEPLSALWLDELDLDSYETRECYLSYKLVSGGETVGSGSVLFCAPKHFKFADPRLEVELSGDTVTVKASAYARSVELCCDEDVLFEDNYFDMDAGERRIKILRGRPEKITARSVYDIK